MAKMRKKFASGIAQQYISRSQAVKKLQVTLKDFRRLCIMKGIYPNEPKNKKKANKGSTAVRTFYYMKDIQFLAHEPIIQKFRDFKIFVKNLKKAMVYKDPEAAARLRRNKPIYKLDHVVKERYPSFADAVRDLDDCLSMCFLYATFPKSSTTPERIIRLCRRLTVEFMHYVIAAKALRKVFVSIKGIYYQAEIQGQTVTWIIPHSVPSHQPSDVDYKIMLTFTEFYVTMLGFVNFNLFHSLNLHYPPRIEGEDEINQVDDRDLVSPEENLRERVYALNQSLQSTIGVIGDDPQADEFPVATDSDMSAVETARVEFEKVKHLQNLFSGKKFFLNREVSRETLVFIIRSCGGQCSWNRNTAFGATFDEHDSSIDYQISDRPRERSAQIVNRDYLQPQWIFDCVNARELLPVEPYFAGQRLPPHLSPFVDNSRYQPLKDIILTPVSRVPDIGHDEGEVVSSDSEADEKEEKEAGPVKKKNKKDVLMAVKKGVPKVIDLSEAAAQQAAEEKKLSIMMMPKKRRHLYEKIMHSKKEEQKAVNRLQQKRKNIEDSQRTTKKRNI